MGNAHHSTVFRDKDGYTVLQDKDGRVIAESNTTPETVIQAGWDRKGDCKMSGVHPMSAGYTGLKFVTDLLLYADYTTKIQVPQGYTGGGIVIDPVYNGQSTIISANMIGGLKIEEQGTPARNWDGILFKLNNGNLTPPSTAGCCFSTFGNIYVKNAKSALTFDIIHADGWITSTKFERITVFGCKNGVECRNTLGIGTQPGISTLHIEDLWWQTGTMGEYGAKNIIGNNFVWDNCAIWDCQVSTVNSPPDAAGANMHSSQWSNLATNQVVLGGIMMHWNVDNQAGKGQVRWIDGHGPPPQWEFYKFLYSQNGSPTGSKLYTIPHGLGTTPDFADVKALSKDASIGPFIVTKDATNVYITYIDKAPPPSTLGNTNNVRFEVWVSVK
jgi:hypothetical protein